MLEKVVYLTAQSYLTEKMDARRARSVSRVIGEMSEVNEELSCEHVWTVCQWNRTLSDEVGPQATFENQQVARALDAHLRKAVTALKKDDDLLEEARKLEMYQNVQQDFATDISETTSASLQAISAGITDGCEEIRRSVNLPDAIKSLSDMKLYSLLSCNNTACEDQAFEHFSAKCLAFLEQHLGRTATVKDILSCAGQESTTELAMACVEYASAIEDLFKPGKSPAVMGVLGTPESMQTELEEGSKAIGINDATTAKELFRPEVIRLLHCPLVQL